MATHSEARPDSADEAVRTPGCWGWCLAGDSLIFLAHTLSPEAVGSDGDGVDSAWECSLRVKN